MSDLRKFRGLLKAHLIACAELGIAATREQPEEKQALQTLMELCSKTQMIALEILSPKAAEQLKHIMNEDAAEEMGPAVGGMQ